MFPGAHQQRGSTFPHGIAKSPPFALKQMPFRLGQSRIPWVQKGKASQVSDLQCARWNTLWNRLPTSPAGEGQGEMGLAGLQELQLIPLGLLTIGCHISIVGLPEPESQHLVCLWRMLMEK